MIDTLEMTRPSLRSPKNRPVSKATPVQVEKLKVLIEQSLEDHKAEDIVTIALAGKSSIADYMIVASAPSHRQVKGLTEHVRLLLKREGMESVAPEGLTECNWVLIDAFDIIIHIFHPEVRGFYSLEKMWDVVVSQDDQADES